MRTSDLFHMNASLMVTTAMALAVEPPEIRTVHAQPSVMLSTREAEVAVTLRGGHMAPVTFFRDTPVPAPVLVTLRGDFFCLPFGGNSEAVDGQQHPPHGEIAGSPWKIAGTKKVGDVTTLTMGIDTAVRAGTVTKTLSLVDGHNVIYSQHTITGFAGRVPLGHHATLAMPETDGGVRLATSAMRFGMTCPSLFSDPKQREYQALRPGAKWTDLSKVPVAWAGQPDADLTNF